MSAVNIFESRNRRGQVTSRILETREMKARREAFERAQGIQTGSQHIQLREGADSTGGRLLTNRATSKTSSRADLFLAECQSFERLGWSADEAFYGACGRDVSPGRGAELLREAGMTVHLRDGSLVETGGRPATSFQRHQLTESERSAARTNHSSLVTLFESEIRRGRPEREALFYACGRDYDPITGEQILREAGLL